ncbi:MAG: preQ(1) synthase [Phycisphaerales bacterium]|jgi:7-cyano-7-deazaguanine reductase|nr:preQ(1) synthase [Phycisphaerales bacterium]
MSNQSLLDTFETPSNKPFVIEHTNEEFTSVCPVTGQPDFGTILLRYEPSEKCVELKSLKMYYQSFRNEGIYYEAVTNQIRDDLVNCLNPVWLQVVTNWRGRGGIRSTIVATTGTVPVCYCG